MSVRNTCAKVIRAEVVSAYSHCPRKAFLLHCTGDRGVPNEYDCLLEERSRVNRASYLAALQQTNTSICSYDDDRAMSSGVEILTEAHLEAANVEADCDALRISTVQRESALVYEPTIVVGTYRLEKSRPLSLLLLATCSNSFAASLQP